MTAMLGPFTAPIILSLMGLGVFWLYGAAKKAQGRLDAEAASGKRIEAANAKTTEAMKNVEVVSDPDLARVWLNDRPK